MNKIKSQDQIDKERYDHIMETIAWRAGYYRANPHRFVKEVLGIELKLFQKILLYAMMHNHYFMLIGSRGIGKSFLTSLFCCVRGILYPGSMIVVASGSLKQAREFVVKKIQNELMNMSPILCSEIDVKNIKTGQNEIFVPFKNGSYITATTSNQNARGQRSNVLIIDEFRMVDLEVLNQVLRKFNASPRQPRYLNKPEYKHLKERNIEMYLSSAYLKSSWAYKKAQAYTKNFFRDNKKYFICGLPYQLAIREGIYMREQAEDEMSEADFNEMDWEMEMETKWLGATDGALFQFDDINACRRIQNGFMPLKFYSEKNPVPKLMQAEKRIMSVDVALMATNKKKKNDATAIFINNLIQTNDTKYQSNIVYGETFEGLTTDELGIIIMRYFYQYKCTDLVLDCAGVGLSVYDFIIKNQYDPQYGVTYQALTSINSSDMAERCKVRDANKVVWCIKANASFNSEIAILLRNGFQGGNINLLVHEDLADSNFEDNYKGYSKMSLSDQIALKNPYLQITMAIFELIKLDSEVKNGQVKVKEQSNMRKDRYSSLAYNYWVACELERQLKPKVQSTESLLNAFAIRKAKHF